MTSTTSSPRILSIQSHVASGYVGNKVAVFPLQLLGYDVDIINSVQFSNHTGYPGGWEGDVLDGDRLLKLVEGMERNGLLSNGGRFGGDRVGHVLTGYIGSASFLRAIVGVVEKIKALNPACRYVCDPVLGDMGRFYVPEGLVQIYIESVLPLADVLTPNQFEVEQLTGIRIGCIQDAQRACRSIHDKGVGLVLITSVVLEGDDDEICLLASRGKASGGGAEGDDVAEQHLIRTPRLPGQFTGTGDVCAALFLAHTDRRGGRDGGGGGPSLAGALERVAGTMNSIVERTARASLAEAGDAGDEEGTRARRVASRELQLIRSRDDIMNPPGGRFRARRVGPSGSATGSDA